MVREKDATDRGKRLASYLDFCSAWGAFDIIDYFNL